MTQKPLVIILHGIFRTAWSMKLYELYLRALGFDVLNLTYPSLRHDLMKLSVITSEKIRRSKKISEPRPIHFVTHSMGGLIVRYILSTQPDLHARTEKIVMLVPPNKGSEVADFVQQTGWMRPLYRFFYGPAGQQLTTDHAGHHPQITGTIGIIAGGRNANPFAHYAFEPGQKHDGTIGHDNMKLDGLTDFAEVRASHASILCSPSALRLVGRFLKTGRFTVQPTPPEAL